LKWRTPRSRPFFNKTNETSLYLKTRLNNYDQSYHYSSRSYWNKRDNPDVTSRCFRTSWQRLMRITWCTCDTISRTSCRRWIER
jgi:hypothetical protein